MSQREIVTTLCRMCDDHCAIDVSLEDGIIVDIQGQENHPWNQGRTCTKARAAIDMVYHPDRLKKPLKRTVDGWQEIELETALDEIADKIRKIQSKYGDRSMTVWKGEATGFNQQEELAKRFCQAMGSPNYLSVDSLCFTTRYLGYTLQYGAWTAPDLENSDCILLWGTNPPTSHPFMTRMVMDAKEKGAKLIVMDPRLSMIGRTADIRVPLKAGTDGAFAWGLIHLFIKNKWADQKWLDQYTVGYSKFAKYAKKFTPEFTAAECGIPVETILQVAEMMHLSSPKVSNYVGNGLEHYQNGLNNVRAISCLDVLTGSFDEKGGNILTESLGANDLALYNEVPLDHLEPIGAKKFPVLYKLRHENNTMTALDTMISDDPYPIKGMILTAGNPIRTNPNAKKVKEALESLDLLVVRDIFMNECCEIADYILPAATFLERTDIETTRNYQVVSLRQKVIEFPECQDEYQFYHDMAQRLGFGKYFPWKDEPELTSWLLEPTGISMEDLKNHPEGIQYKPIRYRKWEEGDLASPTGKVELTSDFLKSHGNDELPVYIAPEFIARPDPRFPFTLITGARKLLYFHSRNHNIPRFKEAIPIPELEIHSEDAERLNLKDGDNIEITSRIGSVTMPLKIMASNEILKGHLQAPSGWKDNNVNLLTHDDILDPISGYPLLKGVMVNISKVADDVQYLVD